ncbi:MAG: PVC-type heme-binding CxxCH protein, partial [Chryseosolibacter sp.]
LRYGLDNWIYGAYSRSGGQRGYPQFTNHGLPLRFPKNPAPDSADIYPGTDFRFLPDAWKVEPSGGMSQFGLAFDAAGNRFTVWNNIHLRHVVIDAKYLTKNPWLTVSSLMASVSDHGDAATVWSRAENRLDLHESEIGHFTSACGNSIYTGGLFKEPFDDASFVCEPVSNLVHVDLLEENGASFSGKRYREGEEFLTSTDSWFRPVNTTVGPDGGLYVVDFYRKLVEHPAWIAHADDKGIYTHAGVLQESDFLEGNDRGRIYRIVPEDFSYKNSPRPALRGADTQSLVSALSHPNRWWRITAQRLLMERQDPSAIALLEKLIGSAPSPAGKIHALRTLQGMEALNDDLILGALYDQDPHVRRQAVLLGEQRMNEGVIRDQILSMASDGDAAVQLQVALTLTEAPSDISFGPLQRIAVQHIADPWFRQAVLLNAEKNALAWFRTASAWQLSDTSARQAKVQFLKSVTSIIGARRQPLELSELLSEIGVDPDPAVQTAGLQGLQQGIRPADGALSLDSYAQQELFTLIGSPSAEVRFAALDVAERLNINASAAWRAAAQRARQSLRDAGTPAGERVQAIRVLGLHPAGIDLEVFGKLLGPAEVKAIQSAAAQVLLRRNDTTAMRLLLTHLPSYTNDVRAIVENAFVGSDRKLSYFIEALEDRTVDPSWLSATSRSRLSQHADQGIRQRAQKLFGNVSAVHRDTVVTAYYEATTLPGDVAKGMEIFRTACSSCHRIGETGRAFGPDLLSVSNQTKINLLTMILDPNKNIAPGYDGYLIETRDGKTLAGILANESSTAVMVRTPDGVEQVIARGQIKSILPMSTSLMPEGLEANYTVDDLAGLLQYLKIANNQ